MLNLLAQYTLRLAENILINQRGKGLLFMFRNNPCYSIYSGKHTIMKLISLKELVFEGRILFVLKSTI
jgi:hypothetical protein